MIVNKEVFIYIIFIGKMNVISCEYKIISRFSRLQKILKIKPSKKKISQNISQSKIFEFMQHYIYGHFKRNTHEIFLDSRHINLFQPPKILPSVKWNRR